MAKAVGQQRDKGRSSTRLGSMNIQVVTTVMGRSLEARSPLTSPDARYQRPPVLPPNTRKSSREASKFHSVTSTKTPSTKTSFLGRKANKPQWNRIAANTKWRTERTISRSILIEEPLPAATQTTPTHSHLKCMVEHRQLQEMHRPLIKSRMPQTLQTTCQIKRTVSSEETQATREGRFHKAANGKHWSRSLLTSTLKRFLKANLHKRARRPRTLPRTPASSRKIKTTCKAPRWLVTKDPLSGLQRRTRLPWVLIKPFTFETWACRGKARAKSVALLQQIKQTSKIDLKALVNLLNSARKTMQVRRLFSRARRGKAASLGRPPQEKFTRTRARLGPPRSNSKCSSWKTTQIRIKRSSTLHQASTNRNHGTIQS